MSGEKKRKKKGKRKRNNRRSIDAIAVSSGPCSSHVAQSLPCHADPAGGRGKKGRRGGPVSPVGYPEQWLEASDLNFGTWRGRKRGGSAGQPVGQTLANLAYYIAVFANRAGGGGRERGEREVLQEGHVRPYPSTGSTVEKERGKKGGKKGKVRWT